MAQQADRTALALDPEDPDANRIAGFLSYWSTRDIHQARPYFEKALSGAGEDYLISLWYGNALVDAGEVKPALGHLARALSLAPDSTVLQADYAVALWQAGDTQRAKTILNDVEARAPGGSTAPNWLALFALAEGDIRDYLTQSERWAAAVGDKKQIERVAGEAAAFRKGGEAAVLRQMLAQPSLSSPYWHGGDLPQAIAASRLGDQAALQRILMRPRLMEENWRDLRFPAGAFARWAAQPGIHTRLNQIFKARDFMDYRKAM